jgi:hypothetical protein
MSLPMILETAMRRREHDREARPTRLGHWDQPAQTRLAPGVPEPALLTLQRTAGNRAVSRLVDRSRSRSGSAHHLLLRQGAGAEPDATGGAAAVTDASIGQPPPVHLSATDLLKAVTLHPAIELTGGSSGTTGEAAPPSPAEAAPTTSSASADQPSRPHWDPTLGLDPFNIQVALTRADWHRWRLGNRMTNLDILADPSVTVQMGVGPDHAVAAQLALWAVLLHINRHGDSFLDIGFGPTGTVDQHGGSLGAQAQVEEHVTNSISITFTTTVTPRLTPDGGVDLHPAEVVGMLFHL